MSLPLFCCSSINPFRPQKLDHETKFTAFMKWARAQTSSTPQDGSDLIVSNAQYVVQLVKQINYGPQEWTRYFAPLSDGSTFVEAKEDDLVKSNFEKLNSYKNFRCGIHDKFFEVNLYQKNPNNTHHWRSNLARPSRDIDLAFRPQRGAVETAEGSTTQEKKHEPDTVDAFQGMSSSIRQAFEVCLSLHKLLPALEETQKPESKDKDKETSHSGYNEGLKKTLQFLLSQVGKQLDSDSLVTLLCLDQANTELNLGLNFERLWERELADSSNILLFFTSLLVENDISFILTDIDGLVIPAMRYVDSRKAQLPTGKARLHEIVKKVLESGSTLDWVSTRSDDILRVFTSGPSEALLERCRSKDDTDDTDDWSKVLERRPQYASTLRTGDDEVDKSEGWRDRDSDDFDYGRFDSYRDADYDSDPRDFTACDKECGYCGKCDY